MKKFKIGYINDLKSGDIFMPYTSLAESLWFKNICNDAIVKVSARSILMCISPRNDKVLCVLNGEVGWCIGDFKSRWIKRCC